jgi:Ca2+/H+ antiporter, TMEM165/GDT1 family
VEAFFVSTVVVGLAEIGDKTQILALMLAARFLRPVPIIFGIFFCHHRQPCSRRLGGHLLW